MQRGSFLTLTVLALAAPVLYIYGPEWLDKQLSRHGITFPQRTAVPVEAETSPVRATLDFQKAPEKAQVQPTRAARRHAATKVARPGRADLVETPISAPIVTSEVLAVRDSQASRAATQIVPAHVGAKVKASRWIHAPSGASGSEDFVAQKRSSPCQSGRVARGCSGQGRDLAVVGIVMATDGTTPMVPSGLKGKIRQGSYYENRPALYVE